MKRPLLLLTSLVFITLFAATDARAEKMFSITSEPDGARVEINGQWVGTTPLQRKMKDHFLNGPKYLWSDWLGEPLRMSISKEGYVAQTGLITSEPADAEIDADGQFDSSTPSKILLASGEHTVRVTRPGFKAWERKITVEPGAEKTVNALLEKEDAPVAWKGAARPQACARP